MQNKVLHHLSQRQLLEGCSFPRLIATVKAEDMVVLESAGCKNYLRVLSYIEGKEMWDFAALPPYIYSQVGELTAKMMGELEVVTQYERIQQLVKYKDSELYCMNIMNFMTIYADKRQYLDADIRDLVEAAR